MATLRRTGAALAVAQVTETTVTDTWATGDDAVLTINTKDLTLTAGSTATNSQIAADIVDMWNGADANGDETRSEIGTNIVEAQRITASASTADVILTADDKGVPFTVTVSETTAGDGTLSTPSTTTAATGPNHWDNGDNYDNSGAAPANSDNVYIDNTNVPILYGLDASSVTLASLTVGANVGSGFAIGLPKTNANGYPEYRGDYLQIGATLLNIYGGNRVKINLGSVQSTILVNSSGSSNEQGVSAVLLKGSHASNSLEVINGSVGFAEYGGETGTLATLRVSGGTVFVGAGATLSSCTATIGGGTVSINSNISTISQTGGLLSINGTATVGSLTVEEGATCQYNSAGTCTAATIRGTLDLSGDTSPVTFTDLTLGEGARIIGPLSRLTVTNNIQYTGPVAEVSVR